MAFWNKEKIYHYNPKTGEVSRCRAKSPETCPFGAENHSKDLDQLTYYADVQNRKKLREEERKARLGVFGSVADKVIKTGGNVTVHIGTYTQNDFEHNYVKGTLFNTPGDEDVVKGVVNWVEEFHKEHPDSIECFDELMRDLGSVNLKEVSLDFKDREDIRSYNEIGSVKLGTLSYSKAGSTYYSKYRLSNVDSRGNDGYIIIGRTSHASVGDGETAYYDMNKFESCPELFKIVFEKTKGNKSLREGIDRANFVGRCFGNIAGIGRELYKKSSQEVFKDLYDDRLYDLESEYGEDSQEVKRFKKSLEGVNCLDSQDVIDNGYTKFQKSHLSGLVLKMLNVDEGFVHDAMWSRIQRDLFSPQDENIVEKSEDGSYITKDIGVLKGGITSTMKIPDSEAITIFDLRDSSKGIWQY